MKFGAQKRVSDRNIETVAWHLEDGVLRMGLQNKTSTNV